VTIRARTAEIAEDEGPSPKEPFMIKGLIFGVIFFLIATFPATWLLMLFLGNVGVHTSYWGTLPLGILVSVLLAGATSPSLAVIDR
jgi:hypothetical protein